MRHLNYNHLLYFWTVTKEGSIARASEVLHLTPQTISGQLKLLDEAVGEPLFQRVGRRLVPTDMGQTVFQYADEIFSLGTELAHVVRGRLPGGPLTLQVGVVNSMPKLVAYRIMAPALSLEEPLRIICREASLEQLLADLAVHRLDLVLADSPLPSGLHVKAYNHALGACGVSFFARPRDARGYRRGFPASLREAPILLPSTGTALRRGLDQWLDENELAPRVVGEFDDSALLKAFGQAGAGVFPGPTAIEAEICKMYHAAVVGRIDDVKERFYAISPERRLKHPAVIAIREQARTTLPAGV